VSASAANHVTLARAVPSRFRSIARGERTARTLIDAAGARRTNGAVKVTVAAAAADAAAEAATNKNVRDIAAKMKHYHRPRDNEILMEPFVLFAELKYCARIKTRWLYCVECPQYSIRLQASGYLCASCLLPAFDAASIT